MRRATRLGALLAVLGTAGTAHAYGLEGFPYGGVYELVHTAPGAVDLTNFQVQIRIDTAAEIAAGRMKADCSDLRVYVDDGCAPQVPVSFWVADGTCNTAATNVWLGLPSIQAGATTQFAAFWGNPDAVSMSDGAAVFPIFFDDFNGPTLDTAKWDQYAPQRQSQANGVLAGGNGTAALWTRARVMEAGKTVFGVRTNAQAQSNADIEYGASTFLAPGGGNDEVHWSSRTYSGVTWMAYDRSAAFVGAGPNTPGDCAQNLNVAPKWTNDVGDDTFFQTEFFYEILPDETSKFGIYDKLGTKLDVTLGGPGCKPNLTESAYFQFDHTNAAPNPLSALDYAYVRKYANPDPVGNLTGITLRESCGLANGTGPCTEENAATVCKSGACSAVSGVCVPAVQGSCWADDDCAAGTHCDRANFTCKQGLPVGSPLPDDGLHDDCPANGVSAACETNLCNPVTDTCAAANGGACVDDASCRSNICDQDDLCGYTEGGGPCTTATQADVCRSGRCGSTGVCLAATGCAVDADCDADLHCDGGTSTCIADLSNGTPIPSDRGVCGNASGPLGSPESACASGACNPITNTCAATMAAETPCTAALECANNICSANGRCGYENGSGPCTEADVGQVCQSGLCTNGLCGPAIESDAGAPDAGQDAGGDAAVDDAGRGDAGAHDGGAGGHDAGSVDWQSGGLSGGAGCSTGSGHGAWQAGVLAFALGALLRRRRA